MNPGSVRFFSVSKQFLASVLLVLALLPQSASEPKAEEHAILAADRAHALSEAGERLIVDVRTPAEWRQTGLPDGAVAVSLHDPDGPAGFVRGVLAAVDGHRNAPIAVICRTGNRSEVAYDFLVAEGFTDVRDIAEGMAGGPNGPGWLPRGLPVEPCTQC